MQRSLADLIKIDSGSTAPYAYGPQGERVWKIAAGVTTYFYWSIGEKVAGQWRKLFVQGLGGKLVESSGGTTWFFATNHLGTIAARMNVRGTLMETYRYLPPGEGVEGEGASKGGSNCPEPTGPERLSAYPPTAGRSRIGARHDTGPATEHGGRSLAVPALTLRTDAAH